jgi:hypothetical protein
MRVAAAFRWIARDVAIFVVSVLAVLYIAWAGFILIVLEP